MGQRCSTACSASPKAAPTDAKTTTRTRDLPSPQLPPAAPREPVSEEEPACGFWRLNTRRGQGDTAFAAWNVRTAPFRTAAIVGAVSDGTVLGVREQTPDGWLRVPAGWVQREQEGAGWEQCVERSRRVELRGGGNHAIVVAPESSDDDGFDTAEEAQFSSDSDGEAAEGETETETETQRGDAVAAAIEIDVRSTATSSTGSAARVDLLATHEPPSRSEQDAREAFGRADADGDGAVNATDLAKWYAVEHPHAREQSVHVFEEMIAEFGWEFDDEEVVGPGGTKAVGVHGFVQVWKHLVSDADEQKRTLLAEAAFGRADADGDGAVNATDLAKWYAVEHPHAHEQSVHVFEEMIAEFGWEFDDEEVVGPGGTKAVGVHGFVQVWKHLVDGALGELQVERSGAAVSAASKVGAASDDDSGSSIGGFDTAEEAEFSSDSDGEEEPLHRTATAAARPGEAAEGETETETERQRGDAVAAAGTSADAAISDSGADGEDVAAAQADAQRGGRAQQGQHDTGGRAQQMLDASVSESAVHWSSPVFESPTSARQIETVKQRQQRETDTPLAGHFAANDGPESKTIRREKYSAESSSSSARADANAAVQPVRRRLE